MLKYILKLFSLVIIIQFTIACKSTKLSEKEAKVEVSDLTVTNVFLTAKRDLIKGKQSAAMDGFNKCIDLNPAHDASYYELARIYEYQNPLEAIEFIKKAVSIDETNIWYKEFLIRLYKDQHNYTTALKVNEELIVLQPLNKQYYYQRANLYIYNKDVKNAGKTYDKIIDLFGYEQGVLEQQKQIYLSNGNYKQAILVLEELITHNPKNKDYYGMLAEIYLNNGGTDKAMSYYQKILEIDPEDGYVHFALADYYYSKGEVQKSFDELEKGMRATDLNVNSKMKVLMRIKELAKDNAEVTVFFKKLLAIATQTHPKEPKILALNADYYFYSENIVLAISYYKRILAIDSSKFVIWDQLLICEHRITDSESLLKDSERALHLFPQQASLYFYNGVANANIGNWKIVKERAKMGLNFIYKTGEKAAMLSLLAKAEMHLGEIDNAIANYNTALKLDPENIDTKRDYAYYLALNKRNISKAISMAKSVLELDANNPHSIFVYSYCLYKDGQTEQALKWIRPAMLKYPDNKQLKLLDMEINKNK